MYSLYSLYEYNFLIGVLSQIVADCFPITRSTLQRSNEFFPLMEEMFDFIIDRAHECAYFSETPERFATCIDDKIKRFAINTMYSFIDLINYGFDDPSQMSYNTLHKRTKIILEELLSSLKWWRIDLIKEIYRYDLETLDMILFYSNDFEYPMRYYDVRKHTSDGIKFSTELTDYDNIEFFIDGKVFAQYCSMQNENSFHLPYESDYQITSDMLIQDKWDYFIEDFPKIEDKLVKQKPFHSMKKKLKKKLK